MAVDSDVRVEERESPLRRARPVAAPSLPAPLAEAADRRAGISGSRRGDWTPFIVIGVLLAAASVYVTYGQAQWLSVIGGIQALAMSGQVERATAVFERAAGFANDVGLLAEEVDAVSGKLLGNFPQAFSHIGLVNAAWAITEARRPGKPG